MGECNVFQTRREGKDFHLDIVVPDYNKIRDLQVATESLEPGENATAVITNEGDHDLITFGVPKGADGQDTIPQLITSYQYSEFTAGVPEIDCHTKTAFDNYTNLICANYQLNIANGHLMFQHSNFGP